MAIDNSEVIANDVAAILTVVCMSIKNRCEGQSLDHDVVDPYLFCVANIFECGVAGAGVKLAVAAHIASEGILSDKMEPEVTDEEIQEGFRDVVKAVAYVNGNLGIVQKAVFAACANVIVEKAESLPAEELVEIAGQFHGVTGMAAGDLLSEIVCYLRDSGMVDEEVLETLIEAACLTVSAGAEELLAA